MHRHPLSRGRLARRALAAVTTAALLAPALARAQDQIDPEWRASAGLGLSLGTGDEDYSATAIRVDAERTLRVLSPTTRLGLVVSLGMTHPSGKATVPVAFDPYTGTFRTAEIAWDANAFELVPAARVAYAASPSVSFYADGGLGVAYTATRVDVPPEARALGISGGPGDGIAGVLRLGGGLLWSPTAALRVAVEAVGLHARFGGGVGTSFDLLVSVSHRL